MSRILIVFGLVLVLTGLLWPVLGSLGLGRLPGDIVVQRDNTTFYFPLVTSILISIGLTIVLNLAFWLFNR
jgi:hypothetical protein